MAAIERRVRFAGIEVYRPRASELEARVNLEWDEDRYTGSAGGESGETAELRIAALATVEALQKVLSGKIQFELIGVKLTRIFDHDLVAVLLNSEQARDRRLFGSALVTDSPSKAAALAVLNATNRLLGNYLVVD